MQVEYAWRMLRRPYLVWVLILLAVAAPAAAAERPITLLISIDGFRADYLDRGITPVLSRMAEEGARGAMRPSFPSKTFPNHYTLVTGLRPDRNGVVENNMEDPAIPGVTFRMSNRDAVRDRRWWDQAEPIWVAAEKVGIPTAPYFWPGAEAPIRGVRPRYWVKFDMDTPNAARVDRVLAWMDLPPARRPRFVTLYFDTVDTAGHDYGPDSPELDEAVAAVDVQIGRLAQGFEARGLAANLIVVADHGMAPMSPDRQSFIDDVVPLDAVRILGAGAFVTLYPAKGREAEVDQALIRPHEHFQCWRKAEIPGRFRYGKNPRVAPYFCLPETGWRLGTRDYRPSKPERGAHGFDPASAEMAAVFIAHGPAFRAGVRLPDFNNVSVYPLLARLVGVAPRPNDGDIADVVRALK